MLFRSKSQQADERDVVPAVSRLIAQLGVGGLVALIAEITEQQSDYFLLSGERQKAAQACAIIEYCNARHKRSAAEAAHRTQRELEHPR